MRNSNIDINNKKLYTLKNDIRLLLLPIDETDIININITLLLGNNHETNKTFGLTHYMEHLIARFTSKKYKNYAYIAKKLHKMGANSNAYVSNYKTNFWIEGLYSDIEFFIDILSNTFNNFHTDNSILSKEKDAVINEVTNYMNENDYMFYNKIWKYLYNNKYKIYDFKYDIKTLKKFKNKNIYKFINKHILLKNMLINKFINIFIFK